MKFLDNKYTRTYFAIIEKARTKNRVKNSGVYLEDHHIIPRSFGGTRKKDNMVLLTAREHFIVHLLLVKMVNGKREKYQMSCAAGRMAFGRRDQRKLTSHQYQLARSIYSKGVSEFHRGKVLSEETRSKMRLRTVSPEHRKAISVAQRSAWTDERKANLAQRNRDSAKPHSDEHKKRISEGGKRGWTGPEGEARRLALVERNRARRKA